MATNSQHDVEQPALAASGSGVGSTLRACLAPLASLKLTVVLLAMGIFLVLAGTLAQAESDLGEVVSNYFRSPLTIINTSVFFPKAWFPEAQPHDFWGYRAFMGMKDALITYVPKFPYPGGFLIGSLMALNLLAAHSLRFTVQARGARVWAGLAVLLAGIATTWLVIAASDNTKGLQDVSVIRWDMMWLMMKLGLLALGLGGAVASLTFLFTRSGERRTSEFGAALVVSAIVVTSAVALLIRSDIKLGDSGMRILWQLLQGGVAGVVLLAGCVLLFKKRAGIVLLHGGVALLMANELLVTYRHEEAQMHLREGETLNWVQDIRAPELAIIDSSDPAQDKVTTIPAGRLAKGNVIQDKDLPFDLRIDEYYKNAAPRLPKAGDKNPATAGSARAIMIEPHEASTGTDTDGMADYPGTYLTVLDKSGKSLGTYGLLLSNSLANPPVVERVRIGNKTYQMSFRFKRVYKPYSITLVDVRSDKYMGTDSVRNYSSDILLSDPAMNVKDRPVRIWMNNPLRYGGDTLYQSSVRSERHKGQFVEVTGLQVVKNEGWMIPYVACMITAVGMLAQFVLTLSRFLSRRAAAESVVENAGRSPLFPEAAAATSSVAAGTAAAARPKAKKADPVPALANARPESFLEKIIPAAVVTLAATVLIAAMTPPKPGKDKFKLYEFGKLPVVYEGRVKPLDTVARNALRIISNRETFYVSKKDEQPAIRWLLDLMTESAEHPQFEEHKIIRIDNPEVLSTLALKPRAGFLYSLKEIMPNLEEFDRQASEAHELPAKQLTAYQRKLLETDRRFRSIQGLRVAFRAPPMPDPKELDPQHFAEYAQAIQQYLDFMSQPQRLNKMPLAIPTSQKSESGETVWKPYSIATVEGVRTTLFQKQPLPPAVAQWQTMLTAYANGQSTDFNDAVSQYRKILQETKPSQLHLTATDFEAFFNHALPFYYGCVLYVFSFVLVALSWLLAVFGKDKVANRSAFWLIAFTLGVHTLGIVARIYISGRPPVTNLYSSAIFISWGCVALGLLLERLYGRGIGNAVSAITGFSGLVIGHLLSGDGDTFTVLQAVLDTQFWLATHVVCISLGYATTFLAGFLGIFLVISCVAIPGVRAALGDTPNPQAPTELRTMLGKMIYGIICFATFFSFVGTVLGGLWADDSWGRFWGWDPKENGALIIVLWNALVLHARWDRMIGDRGLALLSIVGNIVTSWSWFGVNELGIGLHSYGFTDGVLLALGCVVAAHLLLIATGGKLLFLHPEWKSHVERVAYSKCSPAGYATRLVAIYLGLAGMALMVLSAAVFGALWWANYRWGVGGYRPELLRWLAVPVVLAFASEALYRFSQVPALLTRFRYDPATGVASWNEDGQTRTFKEGDPVA